MYAWSHSSEGWLRWHLNATRDYAAWDACGMASPRSALVNDPQPIIGADPGAPLQLPACLALDHWLPASAALLLDANVTPRLLVAAPVHSISMTVFNQEEAVVPHLAAALELAASDEPFELVVVFDDCRDRSIALAHAYLSRASRLCWEDHSSALAARGEDRAAEATRAAWLTSDIPAMHSMHSASEGSGGGAAAALLRALVRCPNPALVHVRTLIQPTPVWEATANNIGMRVAHPSAQFLLLLQDDMLMQARGYNARLALPLRLWPDVFAASARCAHALYSALPWGLGKAGRCGKEITEPLHASADVRCRFHVRDSCNRGPLLLSHARARELGFFDEVHFHLDFSDHDLMARAYLQRRWVVGWMPLDFAAPLLLGATRRPLPPSPPSSAEYLALRLARASTWALGTGLRRAVAQGLLWAPHDEARAVPGGMLEACLRDEAGEAPASENSSFPHPDPPWWAPSRIADSAARTTAPKTRFVPLRS